MDSDICKYNIINLSYPSFIPPSKTQLCGLHGQVTEANFYILPCTFGFKKEWIDVYAWMVDGCIGEQDVGWMDERVRWMNE